MNDTHQIQHALNGMNENKNFMLPGNPGVLCEFDELFAKIQSICKCSILFQNLLIWMPMQDGLCRRNTLILRLVNIIHYKNKQHVWLNYLNPSITDPTAILQLKEQFCTIFIDACNEYFANNYAASEKEFKQLLCTNKEQKETQKIRQDKKKFNLQNKASKETVEVAKKRYRKNLISWCMLIDDHDLAENAIIETSAQMLDGDFETSIANGAKNMHGRFKLPTTEDMEMGEKAGALTFVFV